MSPCFLWETVSNLAYLKFTFKDYSTEPRAPHLQKACQDVHFFESQRKTVNFGVEEKILISNSNAKGHRKLFVYHLVERVPERQRCLEASV